MNTMPTYYVWSGVGAIEDLDGDDLHPATNRGEAWEVFRMLGKHRGDTDLTLWERDGQTATLLAVVTGRMSDGTRCFQSIDPDKSSKPLSEKEKK